MSIFYLYFFVNLSAISWLRKLENDLIGWIIVSLYSEVWCIIALITKDKAKTLDPITAVVSLVMPSFLE